MRSRQSSLIFSLVFALFLLTITLSRLQTQSIQPLKTLEKFDVTNQHICEMNRGMKNYTNISNPYWKISTTSAL